ncbi:MAG: exodeoxyribonuclease VII large subunit [Clostridiales bacterium]|nr:exodeoxyribonuclease VII large subunit [Clostridiales bacterium]
MFRFDSVSVFNNYIRNVFSADGNLNGFELTGEISEFKVATSGHCYFKLKDQYSVCSCVIFRSNYLALDFKPASGDEVVIKGSAELYSPTGSFQIKVSSMKKKGSGDLHEQFLKLFNKLKEEGLFDESHKKAIPVLPRKIGIVTSASGAVIHDIIDTLKRRNPNFNILIYPSAVQGETCPDEVVSGLLYFENSDVDVVIVARGGGSYEDLFGFNDERIARTIYDMTKPVISAIGHEVDYTICDYVSDLRAPTPTAAAELVMGKYSELSDFVSNSSLALESAINRFLDSRRQQIINFANHKALASPLFYAQNQKKTIDNLEYQMKSLMNAKINNSVNSVASLSSRLETLDPNNVLKRGYSFVSGPDGRAVESVDSLKAGADIRIILSDGSADAKITNTYKNQEG